MKNIKKTILGVAILAISLVVMMRGSVNAANVAAKTEVNKDKNITVSVNLEKAASAVEFNLKYDPSKFDFVSASAGDLGTPTANDKKSEGVVVVAALAMDGKSTTSQLTFEFKAKELTESAVPFTISQLVTDQNETISTATANVKVVEEKQEETNKPQESTGNETNNNGTTVGKAENNNNTAQKEDTKNTNTNANTKANEIIGTNGKAIKKLPQTGTPVFIGVAILIVVAGAVLVIRKIK